MKQKHLKLKKLTVFDFVIYFMLIILMFLFIFPFWQTIVTSFLSSEDAMKVGLKIIPTSFTLESYAFVFRSQAIWTAFFNTVVRNVVGTFILVLWTAVTHWNAWFDAMIYCPKPKDVVLQLYLRRMIVEPANEAMIYEAASDFTTQETIKSATIMIAVLPIICVYPFLQKHFVKGVMVGALKG